MPKHNDQPFCKLSLLNITTIFTKPDATPRRCRGTRSGTYGRAASAVPQRGSSAYPAQHQSVRFCFCHLRAMHWNIRRLLPSRLVVGFFTIQKQTSLGRLTIRFAGLDGFPQSRLPTSPTATHTKRAIPTPACCYLLEKIPCG